MERARFEPSVRLAKSPSPGREWLDGAEAVRHIFRRKFWTREISAAEGCAASCLRDVLEVGTEDGGRPISDQDLLGVGICQASLAHRASPSPYAVPACVPRRRAIWR